MDSPLFGQQLFPEPLKSLVESHEQTKTKSPISALLGSAPFKPFVFPASSFEYGIVALKEAPTPEHLQTCENPQHAADYWRLHIPRNPYFNRECECLVALFLNTRKKIKGHQLISIGTLDTILIHPREVFKLAILTSAAGIVLAHNHPSGDATPSEADIKVTRDLVRASQILKIELIDHIVMGNPKHSSLRELGYMSL